MEANGVGFGVNLHSLPYLPLECCLEACHCPEQGFLWYSLVVVLEVLNKRVCFLACYDLFVVVHSPLICRP